MTSVGEREVHTQQRVVAFLLDALGYRYLGQWRDRAGNSNIERSEASNWLKGHGHNSSVIDKTLNRLEKAAAVSGSKTLYDANRELYGLLRYGVKVQPEIGAQNETVWLIDWQNPVANDFAFAEEVTITGPNTKRPDIVIYVNGIALGVLELKRSTVSVAEGIRQNLDSEKAEFIRSFFATVQLVLAGNETEGIRYGVIETPEKYWLHWKETDSHPAAGDNRLLRELGQLCGKERLLELIHDFVVFDAGVKKICRHNQYFGVQAAQAHVRRRDGGIIWHTQGSGKSLTMVWLAKWIREHVSDGRVLIVTDRTELDDQIEQVFKGVDEDIHRTTSGANLVQALDSSKEWLVCSLIHKFGTGDEASAEDIDDFVDQIKASLPKDFQAKGDIFVFVDECHRTQSGKLHRAMKTLLPDATLIGFTGTPLLKADKQRSIETFGPYIHTYKYDEAVQDGVVLDLRYEARDIDQQLTSKDRIDQWFETKTRGLTNPAKAQLKQRWGTMRSVLSAQDRLQKIVADIVFDMSARDRLKSGRGNALLVSDSIYSACRIFEMFQKTDLGDKCAIVTSYRPTSASIKGEETGEGLTEKLRQHEIYRKMLAAHFDESEDSAIRKVEDFEREVKERFVKQPRKMKLLIVVDKLLTGFNAPPATCLYIDKSMQDHGLFQAICRVNRLDGEDKTYGHIIDYKDLFRSLEQSISDYTGEAFEGYDRDDVQGLLKDRLKQGRERLEAAREELKALCEPVDLPYDTAAYLRYFCAKENGNAAEIKDNEPKRLKLYKLAARYLRAYADLAGEMVAAGYSPADTQAIKDEVSHFEKARSEVKLASGDYIDLKMYEPAMRHLLDTYIRAEDSETLSSFDDLPLVRLIVERGEGALDALPDGIRASKEAVAETIENNVRRLIVDESKVNPKYYKDMSMLLDTLIRQRKQQAIDYKDYLAKIVALAGKVSKPEAESSYPPDINSAALISLYDNLEGLPIPKVRELPPFYANGAATGDREAMALALDQAIRQVKKADWRGNRLKEREVRNAIKEIIGEDSDLVDTLFNIVKAQSEY